VVIVGGGAAGLAAAYDLSGAGLEAVVLEAAADFGGLASSFRLETHPVERFYHFICRSDAALVRLASELGLENKLFWHRTQAAFYHHGRDYPFGSARSLLSFTPLPWRQRLGFGLHVLRSRYRREWQSLDAIPAKDWLIDAVGREAYDVVWHPLLSVKFGPYHESISAAWLWHRIWRVARSRRTIFGPEEFGYLEYGSATLIDSLVDCLKARPNVTLRLGATARPLDIDDASRVTQVRTEDETFPCDAVISTVALPVLGRLVGDRRDSYFDRVRQVEYIGIACLLLSLKRSFSDRFWTNVNDPRISFNGFIEQTNLNRNLQQAGLHVVYIPFYLPTTHKRFTAGDEALLAEYLPMLRIINPAFDGSWIKEWHVFRAPYAQPIFDVGFLSRMPAHRTSLRNLFVTDATQFYPEDRTISAAITQGRLVAGMIKDDLGASVSGEAA
jgi:protoporphyrinogen oxidase